MNTRLLDTRQLLLFAMLMLTLSSGLKAQGFIRHYPFFTWSDEGGSQSVFVHPDGSFRMTATSAPDFGVDISLSWRDASAQGLPTGTDSALVALDSADTFYLLENGDYLAGKKDTNQIRLRYVSAAGDVIWSKSLDFPGFQSSEIMALRASDNGDVFVRGYLANWGDTTFLDTGFVAKLAPDGNLLWLTKHAFDLTYVLPGSLEPTADGGCVFANYNLYGASSESILRFGNNGNLLWSYAPSGSNLFAFTLDHSLAVNSNQEVLVPAQAIDNDAGQDSLIFDVLNANGQFQHRTNLYTALNLNNLQPQLSFPTADGGWCAVVQHYLLNSWTNYLVRMDANGAVVWSRPINLLTDAFPTNFTDGKELPDGSLVIYGYQSDLVLIKFSADGVIYPHTLTGQVARDSTFNCVVDPFDAPLRGWAIQATGNGLELYASTDDEGRYTMPNLDNGDYLVNLLPPSYLWNACNDSVTVTFAGSQPLMDTLDFPIQALYDCPLMQVDIGTGLLRRCLPAVYHVQYCNVGNQSAESASITITLDPLVELDSASVPFVQTGNEIHFDLGSVAPGACDQFNLYVKVSCDAQLGQTLCTDAHISPDTICATNLPNWSGASIEVSAACQGDSVLFTIRNVGTAPTSQALDFIIVDDHVITRQGSFSLPAGAELDESVLADGSTWRLIAEQEPGFPFGFQMPTAAIEGCNPTGGPSSTGMLNLFPNISGDPFNDQSCNTIVGSYDPNDKQAFPIGVDAQHLIEQNQPLEYQIRFQNTGTDTAFTVVLRDTLSPWLDPATVRPGAASHPYTWTLSGNGILTFVFDNILLPDSNVNELASHGFVQFNIDQKKDLALGTLLENRAGIYFDFNAPVLTNTVFHTVGHNFLPLGIPEYPEQVLLNIRPNPAFQTAYIWANRPFVAGQQLLLRDVAGRLVRETPVQGQLVELQRAGLPPGLYFLEICDAQGTKAVGKIIWAE